MAEPSVAAAREAAGRAGFSVAEEVVLDGRTPRYLAVPACLHPRLADLLASRFPGGLYAHQSRAIEALAQGHDVCLATPTASGKSLVFLVHAADVLLRASRPAPPLPTERAMPDLVPTDITALTHATALRIQVAACGAGLIADLAEDPSRDLGRGFSLAQAGVDQGTGRSAAR